MATDMGVTRLYYSVCQNRLGHGAVRAGAAMARRFGLFRRFQLPLDALELEHDAVVGLMRLWARVHWSGGDGMMPPQQLLALYRLAVDWPGRGDIVELGSWTGLTTSYLATACSVRGEGTVHAVDTFEGTKEGGARYDSVQRFSGNTLGAFQEQIRRAGRADRVAVHVGFTTEAAAQYRGRPIRLLFIDADHSYAGVRGDYEAWFDYVAPGGLIVFHDTLMPEVARFVTEDIRRDRCVALHPGAVESNMMAVTKREAPSGERPIGATVSSGTPAGRRTGGTTATQNESDVASTGAFPS